MPTSGGDNNAGPPTTATAGTSNTAGNLNTPAAITKDSHGTRKYGEPLFGPNIGSVSSGPGWTLAGEKKIMTDELTTEIVNGWIEKSKEPSNPTTTLQALVNLKRPSLRLSPLSSTPQDDAPATDQHLHLHGLEFTYDCDAPKCGVYVYVHLTKDHPDAPATQAGLAKLQVFEIVHDGGFGNKLTIEDGAVLELERFEYVNGVAVVGGSGDHHTAMGGEEKKMNGEESRPGTNDGTAQLNGSNADVSAGRPNVVAAGEANNNSGNHSNNYRRRFSHFNFRKLHLHRRVTGPALTVVDAERNAAVTTPDEAKTRAASKVRDGDGVKVTIRLVALDEQGTELESPNEQLIYLHIVRESARSDVGEEDAKSWVVKVVKREATIGPHTFHLHEIYGLSASGSGAEITPAAHTYPPDAAIPPVACEDDETLQSECLLCLSSPREVVLLPCRHLVACKECALNMVEYGAGGNITYGGEPAGVTATEGVTGGVGVGGGEGNGSVGGSAPATVATSPTTAVANARRKRKAKGWFCPVCREPYTSMLRLTTTAPSPTVIHDKGDGDGSGSEDEGEVEPPRLDPTDNTNNSQGGVGVLGGAGFFRNGFLRTLSGRGRERPADVENQSQNQNPSSGA